MNLTKSHFLTYLDTPMHLWADVNNKFEKPLSLIQQLQRDIGQTGSIIVLNKIFEAGRNKEMAEIYPEYVDYLTDLNGRIYDLADSIKEGFYVHSQFKRPLVN